VISGHAGRRGLSRSRVPLRPASPRGTSPERSRGGVGGGTSAAGPALGADRDWVDRGSVAFGARGGNAHSRIVSGGAVAAVWEREALTCASWQVLTVKVQSLCVMMGECRVMCPLRRNDGVPSFDQAFARVA
jgi:hypothetical protein